MTDTVGNLMEANLLGVFNERDAQRRAVTIESTYAPEVAGPTTRGPSSAVKREKPKQQRCSRRCRDSFSLKPVLSTKRAGRGTWRGSSGLTAANLWPADSM
jgi:hypothetical protein